MKFFNIVFIFWILLIVTGCVSQNQAANEQDRILALKVTVENTSPVKVQARIKGHQNPGCDRLTQTRTNQTFFLQVVKISSNAQNLEPASFCTAANSAFEFEIPLDVAGLKAGTYTVQAGDFTDTFTLN